MKVAKTGSCQTIQAMTGRPAGAGAPGSAGMRGALVGQGAPKAYRTPAGQGASNTYRSLQSQGVSARSTAGGASTTDTVELSAKFRRDGGTAPSGAAESRQSVEQLLDALRARYPGIHILTGLQADEAHLKELAAGLGAGSHLILTDEFLERMGNSEEDYQECRNILTEMLEQLSTEEPWFKGRGILLKKDQAVSWVVPDPKDDLVQMLEEKKQKAEEARRLLEAHKDTKEDNQIRFHSSSYNTTASYAKLARAGSRSAVQMVMSEARRSIGSLRLVVCYGDEKERVKAGMAIRSMQKLLLRGRRKINRLQEETLLEIRKKKAKEQNEEKRVRQLKLELEKKRTKRYSADGAIALEGRLDDNALEWYKRCHPDKAGDYAAETGSIPAGFTGTGEPVAGGAGQGAAGGGFTADQVVVSSAVTF